MTTNLLIEFYFVQMWRVWEYSNYTLWRVPRIQSADQGSTDHADQLIRVAYKSLKQKDMIATWCYFIVQVKVQVAERFRCGESYAA